MHDGYQPLIDTLAHAKRVLITTHIRPDGDALGTTAAMALALKSKGIAAEILLLSHLPTKYAFVYLDAGLEHHDAETGWPASLESLDRFDTLLVCDTGTWNQLPGLRERLENFAGRKLVLDHHQTQEDWADEKVVVKDAAAAAEVAAELIERWGVPLDRAIATSLYVGLVSDTGWFAFSSTRPFTHRLASRLLEAGVDNDKLYQLLYQNERPQRVKLQARALGSTKLLHDDRLAVTIVRADDFTATGAGVTDTEALVNFPLQAKTVEVSIVFTEPTPDRPGPVRISLRSKGTLDCSKFAEQFGGGGHRRAAGLKFDGTLDDAVARVSAALEAALTA